MTIFEIDAARNALIDAETGEITDFAAFEELYKAREEKVENAALMAKEEEALAKAIADEIKTLTERKRVAENNAKRLKDYIGMALEGQKFKTAKVSVSYRNTKSIEVDDAFEEWCEITGYTHFLRIKQEPDKTAIKQAIENGAAFEYARIIEKTSTVIK